MHYLSYRIHSIQNSIRRHVSGPPAIGHTHERYRPPLVWELPPSSHFSFPKRLLRRFQSLLTIEATWRLTSIALVAMDPFIGGWELRKCQYVAYTNSSSWRRSSATMAIEQHRKVQRLLGTAEEEDRSRTLPAIALAFSWRGRHRGFRVQGNLLSFPRVRECTMQLRIRGGSVCVGVKPSSQEHIYPTCIASQLRGFRSSRSS